MSEIADIVDSIIDEADECCQFTDRIDAAAENLGTDPSKVVDAIAVELKARLTGLA